MGHLCWGWLYCQCLMLSKCLSFGSIWFLFFKNLFWELPPLDGTALSVWWNGVSATRWTKLDLVQRALQIWCENSLDPPLIWRVQAKDSTSKWPWRAGSRASEEIPYTRFDLQEFFDPDMEAPTDLMRSYQLSLLCRCESDKSFSHSQATWWHGCRDDVKAIKWSTFPATYFILVFKCNASSRYHHPKNRPVASQLYPWW